MTPTNLAPKTRALLQLVRPPSTSLVFLAIAGPVFSRSGDLNFSLQRAAPLLFASMCTFIINDLDDLEKDKINHPERPLPSGRVTSSFVTFLYFTCLAAALLTTRFWITTNHIAFLYYMGLAIAISYRYIVAYVPAVKPPYVAAASTLPVLILIAYYPDANALYRVAIAVFLFVLGRELCLDVLDRSGDPPSFLKRIAVSRVVAFAFAIQVAGLVLLSLQIVSRPGALVILAMATLLSLALHCWFRLGREVNAIALMKTVMFLGLYFLF